MDHITFEVIQTQTIIADRNFELALKYLTGDGVERDYQKAAQLLVEAATAGHVTARYNLGVMHLHGMGTDKCVEKAADYFSGAANQGHGKARLALDKIAEAMRLFQI